MYIKTGRYTYSCSQPVEVGDLVVLPPTDFGGCSVDTVTEIGVGHPADYDGPIKNVLMIIKLDKLFSRLSAEKKLSLIKQEVAVLGYRLVKKPTPKIPRHPRSC